jgi:hypothetical protein
MVHVPKAQEVLDEAGGWIADAAAWDGWLGRGMDQLRWWASAAAARRALDAPGARPAAFTRDPSQRDAP